MNNLSKILPQSLRNLIWSEIKCGLIKGKDLHKDFNLGAFWGFSYEPKNKRVLIETLSIKNQERDNTCGQESITPVKEIDENTELSEESQTCFMKKDGSVSQNGYSSLKGNLNSQIKNGICEKSLLNLGHKVGWNKYSSSNNLTKEVIENAKLHKIQSYYSVNSRALKLKALDKGKPIYTGMNWYSGFNAGGGYKSKQVISGHLGGYVGGHAVFIRGYDMDFKGHKVYILQNSYGKTYGDSGKFYVSMDYFDKHGHAGYVEVDMPIDLAKFLKEYEGEYVKVHGNATIYKIVNGKKKPFPDAETYKFCSGLWGDNKNYKYVDDEWHNGKELLDMVRIDIKMQVYDAEVLDVVKKYPKEFKALLSSKHLQEEVLKRLK